MVAVLAPNSVSAPHARPVRPGVGSRPALRVIEGGRSATRSTGGRTTAAGVYVRRRIMVAAIAVVVLVALVVGVRAAASLLAGSAAPTTSAVATAPVVPIAADTYVVRPGDTLWSIATRLDPDADPRPLVDALRARAGGPALDAGQRIDVSGLRAAG